MALTIEDVWIRFQNILNDLAPDLTLNPPATEAQIEELEGKLNVTLPDDFKDSLRMHNGVDTLPVGELLDTERIYGEWKIWKGLLEEGVFDDDETEVPEGIDWNNSVKYCWWRKTWIPIVADGSGNGECLDLDPGETGVVGQVICMYHDCDTRPVLDKSFTEWLDNLATKLQNGEFLFQDGYFSPI